MTEPIVAPHDLDAEQAVLCCLLIAPQAYAQVADILEPGDFYSHANGAIFGAAGKLHQAGAQIDVVTLKSRLEQAGSLAKVGGVAYLAELSQKMPTAVSVRHYAEIVLDRSLRRSLLEAGTKLQRDAEGEDRGAAIEAMERALLHVRQRTPSEATSAEQATSEMMTQLSDRANHAGENLGILSGLPQIDRYTLGWRRGNLIILAGRTTIGKSSLAMQFARSAAEDGHAVLVFSLEMSREALMTRLLSAGTGLDCTWLQRGLPGAHGDEWGRVATEGAHLAALSLHIEDHGGRTVGDIHGRALRHGARHGLDLLIVDHLQLLTTANPRRSLVEQTTEISHDLQRLAHDLNVPVIALSQLNREVDKANRKPMLSDLRESGSLEQDADVVLLLHREKTAEGRLSDTAELHLAKNRHGEQGRIVRLAFRANLTKFTELAEERV
jgi:replicative DNA helicase